MQSFAVHFADTVTTPNPNAVAYIGAALGLGADKAGNTPTSADSFVEAYTSASKMDATSSLFALGLMSDDGNGSDPAASTSFMDLGTATTTATNPDLTKATI